MCCVMAHKFMYDSIELSCWFVCVTLVRDFEFNLFTHILLFKV